MPKKCSQKGSKKQRKENGGGIGEKAEFTELNSKTILMIMNGESNSLDDSI